MAAVAAVNTVFPICIALYEGYSEWDKGRSAKCIAIKMGFSFLLSWIGGNIGGRIGGQQFGQYTASVILGDRLGQQVSECLVEPIIEWAVKS